MLKKVPTNLKIHIPSSQLMEEKKREQYREENTQQHNIKVEIVI